MAVQDERHETNASRFEMTSSWGTSPSPPPQRVSEKHVATLSGLDTPSLCYCDVALQEKMNDTLYDTSFTLYAVSDASPQYQKLPECYEADLNVHAEALRQYLDTKRPRYESEEEREKIGGLRACRWTVIKRYAGQKRKRGREDDSDDLDPTTTAEDAPIEGVTITLTYDKATYKFILYAASDSRDQTAKSQPSKRRRKPQPKPNGLPLLLTKSNASLTRHILTFLTTTFSITTTPLKLPPHCLQQTLQTYITSLWTSLRSTSNTHSTQSLLRDTIGTLKITIATNTAHAKGPDIAKGLKSIDVDVPSETLYQLLLPPLNNDAATTTTSSHASSRAARDVTATTTAAAAAFLVRLRDHVRLRTGLILPLPPAVRGGGEKMVGSGDGDDGQEAMEMELERPLKVSRISTAAFALSAEGRLKMSLKAVEAVEGLGRLGAGEGNVVRVVNGALMEGVVRQALGVGGSD